MKFRTKLAAAATSLLATVGFQSATAASPSVIVAHRGFAGPAQVKYNVPENSIAAWDKAIDLAERQIVADIDVQWTSDNVMVAMHDRNLTRTTNGGGYIDEKTWSYVRGLWLELPVDRNKNGDDDNTTQHPPSLEAALRSLKGRTINGVPVKITIEMKGSKWTPSRVAALKTKLQAHGLFTSRVNVHSFSKTVVDYARNAGFPNVGYAVPTAGPAPSGTAAKSLAPNLFIKDTLLTKAKLQEYESAGVRVWIFTVNTATALDRIKSFNEPYYALITDDVTWLQDRL